MKQTGNASKGNECASQIGVKPEPSAEISSDPPTETPELAEAASSWGMLLKLSFQKKGLAVTLVCFLTGLPGIIVAWPTAIRPVLYPSSSAQQRSVSLADYERLKVGEMSLTDAQATLGPGTEISRNETTATYKWVNTNGSEIKAEFESDRLVKKEQRDLK